MTASKDASKVPAPQKSKSKKPEKSDEDIAIDGLMTEIEDDLRGEELAKLWKQYGNIIIAVVTVVIATVIGWQVWRQNVESARKELALQYEAATNLVAEGNFENALTGYAAVAEKKGEGYAALAQLQKAALAKERGDLPGALAAYQALASDSKADPIFRDLATVLRALHGLDTENALQLEASLKPLLDPSNAFSHTARELTVLLASKQGDNARALKIAEDLVSDSTTPAGIRQRAEEFATLFKANAPAVAASAAPAPAPTPATPSTPAASSETNDAGPKSDPK